MSKLRLGICTLTALMAVSGCYLAVRGEKRPSAPPVHVERDTPVGVLPMPSDLPAVSVRRPTVPALMDGMACAVPVDEKLPDVSNGIRERIDTERAEWRQRTAETALAAVQKAPSVEAEAVDGSERDRRLDALLAAERRHSADLLNCRLRISLLKSRLAGAEPANKSVLSRKLAEAEARLASVEEMCRREAGE